MGDPDLNQPLYYGCHYQAGHFPFAPGMVKLRLRQSIARLDGGFTPKTYEQGKAKLTHLTGWTIIAFPDYTIDTRPGSHSTFVLPGKLTFEEALAEAKRIFPQVWARIDYEVSEAE